MSRSEPRKGGAYANRTVCDPQTRERLGWLLGRMSQGALFARLVGVGEGTVEAALHGDPMLPLTAARVRAVVERVWTAERAKNCSSEHA